MVDEMKYLNAVKLVVAHHGYPQIAECLDGARCSIVASSSYSHVRWDCYYTTVYFSVRAEHLLEFTPEVKTMLLEVADKVMPKDENMDVMAVEISPLVDQMPDEDIPAKIFLNGKNYTPLFGVPSSDTTFHCDVFTIMPFDQAFDPVYRQIVVPTVQALGLTIKRGDDPFSRHDIMHEIWSMLNACKLVIADCTDRNPNVFYELGIAHTIGKPVIMLTQNLKALPFDVQNKRAIQYDTAFHKIQVLKDSLRHAICTLLKIEVDIPF